MGGDIFDLTDSCNVDDQSGPVAFVHANGKAGPKAYFQIHACLPDFGGLGPFFLSDVEIPNNLNVTAPYSQSAETTFEDYDGVTYGPAMSTTETITTWGAPHELVKGTFKGSFTTAGGVDVPIDVEFSVCRREDSIAF